MTDIKSLNYDELVTYMAGLGEKKFRASQLYSWMLKIWDADVISDVSGIGSEENAVETDAACGTVCFVDKKRLIIKCGKDYLSVNEVQLEGKKRMKTDAFLLGCRVEKGTVLK